MLILRFSVMNLSLYSALLTPEVELFRGTCRDKVLPSRQPRSHSVSPSTLTFTVSHTRDALAPQCTQLPVFSHQMQRDLGTHNSTEYSVAD